MVNGLGGIFIKASDPKFLARWYEDHLGIDFGTSVYTTFNWKDNETGKLCHTDLSFMASDSTYFYPSDQEAMINLRVNDLDSLRIQLKTDKQQVIDKVEVHTYGRFGWVIDPEGNKVELWEPPVNTPAEFSSIPVQGPVTGIGGFFLKAADPQKLSDWYKKYFGIFFDASSHVFNWQDPRDNSPASTVLSFFKMESTYFSPSFKSFMLNLRVTNVSELIERLKNLEVEIVGEIQDYEYGKFGWFMDPDGNKVELWEPK